MLAPGTIERVRVLFTLEPKVLRMNDGTTCAGRGPANGVVGGMSEPVEGGW